MHTDLPFTFYKFLQKLKITCSLPEIKELLLNHPAYPSLLSVTDCLDLIGLENGAFEISKEDLNELNPPYLVHVHNNGGQFILIEKNPYDEVKDFESNWTKLVVMVEKPVSERKINEHYTDKNDKTKQVATLFVIFLALINLSSVLIKNNFENAVLTILSIFGIIISVLIILTELGIEFKGTSRFCSNDSCDKLIKGSKAKLPFGLSFGDLSLTWFLTLNVANIIASSFTSYQQFYSSLSYISMGGCAVAAFSIYYQAFIVKLMCRLCTLIVVLLLLTSLVLLPIIINYKSVSITVFLIIVSVGLVITSGWMVIKQLIKSRIKFERKMYEFSRFKYNWAVFKSLLNNEREIDISPIQNEIILGNPDAPCMITVTSSLTCQPCKIAHEKLERLISEMPDKVAIRIRFLIKNLEHDLNKINKISYVLSVMNNAAQHLRAKVLHDWYEYMDFEKFKLHYPVSDSPEKVVKDQIDAFHDWAITSEITNTPFFLINDRKLPEVILIDDIHKILRYASMDELRAELIRETSNNY